MHLKDLNNGGVCGLTSELEGSIVLSGLLPMKVTIDVLELVEFVMALCIALFNIPLLMICNIHGTRIVISIDGHKLQEFM